MSAPTRPRSPWLPAFLLVGLIGACAAVEEVEAPEAGPCLDGVCEAAIRKFGFGMNLTAPVESQGVIGFDLDGHITNEGDPHGCGKQDFVSPDGEPGIDNQLGLLLGAIGDVLVIVDDLVAQAVAEGGALYVIEIRDWEGPGDRSARGRIMRTETPPLIGNDGLVLRGQTLGVAEDGLMGEFELTVDAEGRVFESGPFTMLLPIIVLDVDEVLELRSSRVRFERHEDGTMHAGLIGGGIMIDGIIHITDNYAVGAEIRAVVPPLLRNLADLEPDERGRCQALSVALAWEAVPVFTTSWATPGPTP